MGAEELSQGGRLLCAGVAACSADAASFPLDTAKVRLQLQGEGSGGSWSGAGMAKGAKTGGNFAPPRYKGLFGTIITIVKQEGPRGLYKGLVPGLQRQACFASVRIGMYDTFKKHYSKILTGKEQTGANVSIPVRILSGLSSGAMAVSLAQPTDVIKVRMQAQQPGQPLKYKNTIHAYTTTFKAEGLGGLWKGVMPNAARNAIVNVSEIVCYDVVKDLILEKGWLQEGVPCHFTSAAVAGLCATLVASPVDVVKTRFMNSAPGLYRGALHTGYLMARQEGIKSFYKGFFPSFCRLVSWNILMWLSFEQLKIQYTNHMKQREQASLPAIANGKQAY